MLGWDAGASWRDAVSCAEMGDLAIRLSRVGWIGEKLDGFVSDAGVVCWFAYALIVVFGRSLVGFAANVNSSRNSSRMKL